MLSDKWINYILNIKNTKKTKYTVLHYILEKTEEWCGVGIKSSTLNGLYIKIFSYFAYIKQN